MKGFIDEIPREYEEAAMIDGYTRLQAFFKVVLPQATTGIVATAIFCLIFAWNEYAFAVLLTSGEAQTAPPFIPIIIGEGGQDWPAVAAGNDAVPGPDPRLHRAAEEASSARHHVRGGAQMSVPETPHQASHRQPRRDLAALVAARILENLATTLIGAGVLMLLATVLADTLQLLLRHHARWRGDVHHRHQVPGVRRWRRSAWRDLHKSFGDFAAVKGSTFAVRDGEFFCLLGPSGCGKTTTLRMIAGLELPTSGAILLDGEDVTLKRASERDIAMVFQLFALYPHMNVRRNISYPLRNIGTPKALITSKVEEAARILRIEHLLDKSVSGLSGGDRQRVALGRAIVREPKAFMMDEPLGALDAEFRHVMCGELRALHNRLQATTVYVTHDQLEAMAMADHDRHDEPRHHRAACAAAGDLRHARLPCSLPTSSARRR